ncbi:MAG: DUF333 domain-containing protein [Bacteroidales bacterium]|nr:DUF333 domain-containing protein [Bacteroidales bacterium]
MRRLELTAIALLSITSLWAQQTYMRNPATAYAKFMGCSTQYRVDSLGNQSIVCIMPDSSECDEWAFFRGLCGTRFSYCETKGCGTENITDTIKGVSFAVCVCIDSAGNKQKIPLINFMEMNGDTLIGQQKNNHKKRRP